MPGLQRARLAEDPYFHEVMYNMLIDLQATSELLALDTEQLEKHLKTNGGLPPGVAEGPIGPLTPSQVSYIKSLRQCMPFVLGRVFRSPWERTYSLSAATSVLMYK